MNYILSDFEQHKNFLPLSFTRSIADFRLGILTIKEKWEKFINSNISVKTEEYLQKKYNLTVTDNNFVINSALIPSAELLQTINSLNNQILVKDNKILAYNTGKSLAVPQNRVEYDGDIVLLQKITEIFTKNAQFIQQDFELLTKSRKSATLSCTNTVIGNNPIFIEEGCDIECCTFNTKEGVIYVGKNSTIMEGANIRAPFAMCNNSEVKMGAKIYGPTTIGPFCKVGGEVNNVVFFAYSNKAHDGFIGNSVIGEWCNLGADTNCSNLKNNYADVKLWNYASGRFENTGLQFCGLIMGDHSKCGINTMFNTGTVVGVSANIFGAGFPRNIIPSFSWGGYEGLIEYKPKAAFEVMQKVMERRNKSLSEIDKEIFTHIFNCT